MDAAFVAFTPNGPVGVAVNPVILAAFKPSVVPPSDGTLAARLAPALVPALAPAPAPAPAPPYISIMGRTLEAYRITAAYGRHNFRR